MKKTIIFCLVFVLFCCCGCTEKKPQKSEVTQYTVALNPSVMLEDGTVDSIRNSTAKAMSADSSSDTVEALYTNTAWQWIAKEENGDWSRRLIRSLSKWKNGSGSTDSGAPFAYQLDDSGVSSLSAFDSSKMKIKGETDGNMPETGILMSFAEGKEEALCYTAENDGRVILSDRDGGSIAVVSDISGFDTSFFGKKNAKKNVVVRIYKNARIYWQEILNVEQPSVLFPQFSAIDLKKGDRLLITAEATDDIDGIVTGNCDIPAYTAIETVNIPMTTTVEKQTQAPARQTIPFIYQHNSYFTVVTADGASDEEKKIADDFCSQMESVLGTAIDKRSDAEGLPDGNIILVGNTSFEQSKKALNEIKSSRTEHAGDFIIRMEDNSLVINAGSDVGLKFAVDFFFQNYCTGKNSSIESNLEYVSSKFNPIKSLSVAGIQISEYRIVVSRFASLMDISAADYLNEQIVKAAGIMLPIVRDSEKASAYEILIGDTGRTSNNYSTVAATSSGNQYSISVHKNNTVIQGESTAAVNAGVITFADRLLRDGSVKNGFTLNGAYNGGYSLTNGYKLTWSDEFNTNNLKKIWKTQSTSSPSVYGGTVYASVDNAFVDNGALVQRLSRDGNDVKESFLVTQDGMLYKYGYLEARVRLSAMEGCCGSVWLMSQVTGNNGITGEIDVYENFGRLNTLKSNLHTWGPGSAHENILGASDTILNLAPGTQNPEPYSDHYHTIGFEWYQGYIAFYIDGVKHTEYQYDPIKYACFDKPFYLILSVSGGVDSGVFSEISSPPDGFTYTDTYYDWIRIYQTDDMDNVMYTKE